MATTPNYGLIKPKQTDFYNVDDFNKNADTVDTALDSLALKLDGLQIGGRNYLQESAFTSNTMWAAARDTGGAGASTSLANGVATLTGTDTTFKQWQLYPSRGATALNNLELGKTYTISADVYVENVATNGSITASLRADNTSGSMISDVLRISVNSSTLTAGKWNRVTATGTIPVTIAGFGSWRVVLASFVAGTVKFRHPKLELGDKATDWTDAPEDVDAAIATAQDTADAAKVNDYGVFVDNRTDAATGYWYKMFECRTSAYNNTDINIILDIQQTYNGSASALPHINGGTMKIGIRQGTNGAPNTNYSHARWLTTSHNIGNTLNNFAVNVIPDSTGNKIEFYIYSNVQFVGYKVSVIDSSPRELSQKLTFSGCHNYLITTSSLPTDGTVLTALPATGTIFYSTLGEYMVAQSDVAAMKTQVTTNTAAIAALPAIEKGTWTPVMSSVLTIINRWGYYTKIGNMVTVSFYINIDAANASGSVAIMGLPFNCASTASGGGAMSVENLSFTPNGFLIYSGSTYINPMAINSSGRLTNVTHMPYEYHTFSGTITYRTL